MLVSNKKILFNGCSFVHGDDLMWPYTVRPNYDKDDAEYQAILSQFNLSGSVSKLLKTENITNIARFGATNDLIVFSTLDFFNKIPKENRSEYIACIGWSDPCRIMLPDPWAEPKTEFSVENNRSNLQKLWLQLNLMTLNSNDQDVKEKFAELSKQLLVSFNDDYWFKEHIKNILILEQYFKENSIEYVFWNSIGIPLDDIGLYTKKTFLDFVDWTNWIDLNKLRIQYTFPEIKIPTKLNHPYDHKLGIFCSILANGGVSKAWTKTNHPGPEAIRMWSHVILKHFTKKYQ